MAVTSSSPRRARSLRVWMSCRVCSKRYDAGIDPAGGKGVEHEGVVGVRRVSDSYQHLGGSMARIGGARHWPIRGRFRDIFRVALVAYDRMIYTINGRGTPDAAAA